MLRTAWHPLETPSEYYAQLGNVLRRPFPLTILMIAAPVSSAAVPTHPAGLARKPAGAAV